MADPITTPAILAQTFAGSGPNGPDFSGYSVRNFAFFRGYRSANTILKGGWAPDASYNRRVNELTRRKSLFRHPRVEALAPANLSTGFRTYDIDRSVNWVGRKFGATADVYTGGLLGQIDAAARLSNRVAGGQRGPMRMLFGKGMTGGAGIVEPGIAGNIRAYQGVMGAAPGVGEMTGQEGARAILSAAPGALNQAVGGFFYGARYGGARLDAATMAGDTKFAKYAQQAGRWRAAGGDLSDVDGRFARMSAGLRNSYTAGSKRALTAQALKAGGVKTGEEAAGAVAKAGIKRAGFAAAAKYGATIGADAIGLAIPGLDVLAAVSLAYTTAKLVGGAINNYVYKPLRDFTEKAFTSMTGSIFHTPLGGGFVDNSVAATSRARGVMAISASRLNSRSMLGSESSMLYAHFG